MTRHCKPRNGTASRLGRSLSWNTPHPRSPTMSQRLLLVATLLLPLLAFLFVLGWSASL
jgi:hypothetical protein